MRVAVVGAGIGGLSAALRLARRGHAVTVFEARPSPGGLASALEAEGQRFDGGPYILLDRPGLEWAFESLGLGLEALGLRRLEEPYVAEIDGQAIALHADLGRTAAGFERAWPGSAARYAAFVRRAGEAYDRLRPALRVSRPGWRELVGAGWTGATFVFRTLGAVLEESGLPPPVQEALAVWTRIAGHTPVQAPAFMAFVPALVHRAGCYVCTGGMDSIVQVLQDAAVGAGVSFRFGTRVRAIRCREGGATGVVVGTDERVESDVVVSDVGLATYLSLLEPPIEPARRPLLDLPLQSAGGCAYVRAEGRVPRPYLRFRCDPKGTRLLVSPAAVEDRPPSPFALRLIAPIAHAEAERLGPDGQRRWLDDLIDETWWRDGLEEVRVVARRTPTDWGTEFSLHRAAMNPVMTPKLARRGRLAHRSPWVRGLYLVGAATHPGQWMSFCAISGILGADLAHQDASRPVR